MAWKHDCCNVSDINVLLESLFTVSDSALMDASFDVLESRSTDSDQNDFVQRAIHNLSVLLEAGKRFDRNRSSVHNASVWPLPSDLTIKVFSMLDTKSVCSAAATCLFFQECAVDPFCYANIDLNTTFVPMLKDDDVVSTMIQRAGIALRSLKLGDEESGEIDEPPILTSSCLSSLTANGGASGSRLSRLHLYNIGMDNIALLATLSVCPLLINLGIYDLHVNINDTLKSVSGHCRLIQRFIYDSDIVHDNVLHHSVCEEFVLNCPKITTLALIGCKMSDSNALELVKGFQELKHVDFSYSFSIFCCGVTGAFLKNLGTKGGANNLEVMVLYHCDDLKISAVEGFLEVLLAGEFRLLRHLDISHIKGLEYSLHSSNLIKQVLEQRPNFCFVAEYY